MLDIQIKKVKIQNFKSFDHLEFDLRNLNVILGPNASGKSNFIGIFKFLHDIINHGLENAISIQGGDEFLLNSKIKTSENIIFEILFNCDALIELSRKQPSKMFETFENVYGNLDSKSIFIKLKETQYRFELKFHKNGKFFIIDDSFHTTGDIIIANKTIKAKETKLKNKKELGEFHFVTSYMDGNEICDIKGNCDEKIIASLKESLFQSQFYKIPSNTLIIERPLFIAESFFIVPFLKHLSIYDIDTKISKKGVSVTGKKELEEDGSNLPIIIRNIQQNEKQFKQFTILIKNLLPFVDSFDIDQYAGRNLIFKMKEKYFDDFWPAEFLSDGTINIIALILILFFEKKSLIIIEEPERNIHPMLISKIDKLFKDASEKKQIIISTHNPQIVKHTNLEDILLIKRDMNGISKIQQASKIDKVKRFLKSELGIDELFIRGLLGD